MSEGVRKEEGLKPCELQGFGGAQFERPVLKLAGMEKQPRKAEISSSK